MSEDTPLTPEQAAALAAETQAHAAAAPTAAGEQAAAAAVMAAADPGPALPAEADIEAFMSQMRARYDDMAAQLEALKRQQADALASQGTPHVVRYAEGARDKVAALAAAHPDAPAGHFDAVLADAGTLAAEAAKMASGTGTPGALERAAAAVERFALRGHARAWAKHIDWSAILGDLEDAAAAAARLAPAAARVL